MIHILEDLTPNKNEGNPAQKRMSKWVCLGISMPLCSRYFIGAAEEVGTQHGSNGSCFTGKMPPWKMRSFSTSRKNWEFLSMSFFHDCLQDEMPAVILVVPHHRWWDTSQLANSQCFFKWFLLADDFGGTVLANHLKSKADFYCGCAENYKCNTDRCRSCRGAFRGCTVAAQSKNQANNCIVIKGPRLVG